VVAEQPLQPTLYHGPRFSNGTTNNVPSQAGFSSMTPGATATAATSPWQLDQQMAQPSIPPLNSYIGFRLTGAQGGGPTNAKVFPQALYEDGLTPAQRDQQIAYGRDTQVQWRPYTEQICFPRTANLGHPDNGTQIYNEDELIPERQSAYTALPVQDHNDETGTGVWDDFILNDFADSLYCSQ
jgi:hypothetical protein